MVTPGNEEGLWADYLGQSHQLLCLMDWAKARASQYFTGKGVIMEPE